MRLRAVSTTGKQVLERTMEHKTALVIDAGHDVSQWLSEILTPPEWAVRKAPDNTAALELVKSARFDLILTSERSSGKEDIELLHSIRRLHRHTRMIILGCGNGKRRTGGAIIRWQISVWIKRF